MKLTLFTTDENCTDLGSVNIAHMAMFQKNEIDLIFIDKKEQSKFLDLCVKNYILIKMQGMKITLIPESNNYQRVSFRFDSK